MRFILTVLFLLCSPFFSLAQYYYDFNERCVQAYEAFTALRMEEGRQLIAAEQAAHPRNLIPVFIANYEDFLTLMFNGDAGDYRRMKPDMDHRLDLLSGGDVSAPWYRFCKSSVYFQQAAVHIRFNEYLNAGIAFRKSFLLLKENQKKFPDFSYNQILLGLEEALVGTIPENYKWISNMLGMRGNLRGGVARLAAFLNGGSQNPYLRTDAVFYYCYLKFFLLSDREQTWQFLDKNGMDPGNNLLFAFLKANLALNDNKAGLAEQVLLHRNESNDYLDAPLFDYQLGIAFLLKMDDRAPLYFKRFLNRYKGRFFVKDAYQKLSLYYLAKGDAALAVSYKNKIGKAGTAQIDADKQAQRYALSTTFPNAALVRARMNCEGGYYTLALKTLDPLRPSQLGTADQMEYFYRYGRVYNLKGNKKGAIPFYEKAIAIGKDRPEQFAARSALELGEIYEDQGLASKAIAAYQRCLNMRNEDFRSSIEQKAKAGILRLGGS